MKYTVQDYLLFTANSKSNFISDPDSTLTRFKVNVPQNWKSYSDLYWTYFMNPKIKLPPQGWKIHISAGYNDMEKVIEIISSYMFKENITFKVVSSYEEWLIKNSKAADRSESGKFITIYPKDSEQFKKIIEDISKLISNCEIGPYILSDKRYKNTNVYYRYGAFKEIRNTDGVLCIRDKKGNLIPDYRVPFYQKPEFVIDPISTDKVENINNKDKLDSYNISSALSFSNAGGVYLGKQNKRRFVIKEGRKNAGIDSNFVDGFSRIQNEVNNLKKLRKSPYVIKLKDNFSVWIHNYLVEEYNPSETLGDYITNNFPPKKLNLKYINKIKMVSQKLIKAIEDIHGRGVAIGDLQPDNILINSDGSITLIDFEQANDVDKSYNPGLETIGFTNLDIKTYGQADWFAAYKTIEYAFLPLVDIDKLTEQTSEAYRYNNLKVYEKEAYTFLVNYKRMCFKKGKIKTTEKKGKIYPITVDNLDQAIEKIKKGIIDNLDFSTTKLIKGDIDQFICPTGKVNIINGALGLGLVINAFDQCNQKQFYKWYSNNKEKLMLKFTKDQGLFTGAAGIGSVLYSTVDKNFGKKLIDGIDTTKIEDLSIEKGLAGIGLAKLALNCVENDENRKTEIKNIAKTVNDNYLKCQSVGLLNGQLGLLLFLEKVGICFSDKKLVNSVKAKLKRFIKEKIIKTENGIFVEDRVLGSESYLPYLNSGTAGLEMILLEFIKDGISIKQVNRLINELSDTNNVMLSYMNGLFDGFAGLVLADSFAYNMKYQNSLEKKVNLLNNYLVITDEKILVPGVYGLKNSMDLATGAIGLLITLESICERNYGRWIPIIHSDNFSVFKGGDKNGRK